MTVAWPLDVAGGVLGLLLAGQFVFDGLAAGDVGVADLGVEAGQIAFQEIVSGLELTLHVAPREP